MQQFFLKSVGSDSLFDVEVDPAGKEYPNRYKIKWGGSVFQVEMQSDGKGDGILHLDGTLLPFYVVQKKKSFQFWVKGKTYTFEVVNRVTKAETSSDLWDNEGDIRAPMPGRILKIAVDVGDLVTPNQVLLVLESMKMEMSITSPEEGEVVLIPRRVGDLVELGEVLIKLESLDG